MTYDHIMVRFGELSTKGKNKKDFIRVLANNIKNALSGCLILKYFAKEHTNDRVDQNKIIDGVRKKRRRPR